MALKLESLCKGQSVWKKIQAQHLVEWGSSVRSPQIPHGTKFRLADYSCGRCQRSTAVCSNKLDCVLSHTGLTAQQSRSLCTKCSSTEHTTRLTRTTATVSLQHRKCRPNGLQRQHFWPATDWLTVPSSWNDVVKYRSFSHVTWFKRHTSGSSVPSAGSRIPLALRRVQHPPHKEHDPCPYYRPTA